MTGWAVECRSDLYVQIASPSMRRCPSGDRSAIPRRADRSRSCTARIGFEPVIGISSFYSATGQIGRYGSVRIGARVTRVYVVGTGRPVSLMNAHGYVKVCLWSGVTRNLDAPPLQLP
jgi:hypothetical protein